MLLSSIMKLFISHSSKNANYGDALLSLLIEIGVPHKSITYTSSDSHGIPMGENIFDWLKSRFDEKPLVIFLLSNEYYSSVACLNEMGAAWVIGSRHLATFTPSFDLNKPDFRNGALDPRKMGFFIDNEDRVTEFTEIILRNLQLNTPQAIVNRAIQSFLKKVEKYKNDHVAVEPVSNLEIPTEIESPRITKLIPKYNLSNALNQFVHSMKAGKISDEEILLLCFIIDNGREKLGVGWKAAGEIDNIKAWESVNDLIGALSKGYENSIRKIEFRKLATTSELTSNGNPREVTITEEMADFLLNPPDEVQAIMNQVIEKYKNFDLPF